MTESTSPSKTLNPTLLFAAGLAVQVLCAIPLWGHISSGGQIFGRYSTGYALALGLSVGIGLVWLIAFVVHARVMKVLARLPKRMTIGLIGLMAAIAFAIWFTPFEPQIHHYIALNAIVAAAVLVYSLPDGLITVRLSGWIIVGMVILAIPILITILTGLPYSPDEAHWADYATSPYVAGGLYSRTWHDVPVTIKPGLGWSVAGYGWLLENVAFDVRVGRLWNAAAYLLAFVTIGVVTQRLYGRDAAWIAIAVGFLTMAFFPVMDYRPDHQLPFALTLLTYLVVRTRGAQSRRWLADFLVGLLATLSLQLHAAGIVFAAGFSLFYVAEYAVNSYRHVTTAQGAEAVLAAPLSTEHNWSDRGFQPLVLLTHSSPLIAFAIGAAIGTGLHIAFNVLPVGFEAYIDALTGGHFDTERSLYFVDWPSLLEMGLIGAGFAYLLWRRNSADKTLLGIWLCVVVSALVLDSWGYRTLYQGLYPIPVAVLLVDGVSGVIASGKNRRSLWLTAVILIALVGQMVGSFIAWDSVGTTLRTGRLPQTINHTLGEAVRPYITDDDMLVGTHELLWTFPHRGDFFSMAAELNVQRTRNLDDPVQVWEDAAPTVIVSEGRMVIPPGLQTYMAREGFMVCQSFDVGGLPVQIYRVTCPE